LNQKPNNIEEIYELSPLQEGMLFHSLYEPGAGLYVQQFSFPLPPDVDVVALESAWQKLVERHPVLRTSFHWEDLSKPLQVVRRGVNLDLNRQDWRNLPAAEQKSRLRECLRKDRENGFDLTNPPLMRLGVVQLSDEVCHCVWSFHHILLDGWSVQLLFKDLDALYEAARGGEEANLQATRPYRDYIQWLKQRNLAQAEGFWRKTLKGFTAPTPLNVDEPAERSAHAPEYGSYQMGLSKKLSRSLEAMARQHRLTLNTLVQGAWAILLSRYSGEQDVVFGGVVSGRPATLSGVESMVGLFINTLPVRARVSSGAALLSWLTELQKQQLDAREYEYSPMLEIQKWSELPPTVPLFDTVVVFENFPAAFADESDGSEQNDLYVERTNYPLCLVAIPGKELRLWFYFQQGRFLPATIERMAGHLRTLLEGMAANPAQRVGELPLLTAREQHQVLYEWNATGAPSAPQSLVELFEAQAAAHPEAIAFVCGQEELTYGELDRRSNQAARYLQHLGVGPEVVVGVCLQRGLELVAALWGVLKAGGAYLPLDPSYPAERLAFMAADAGAAVVWTASRWADMFVGTDARVVCMDAAAGELAQAWEGQSWPRARPEQMAYVIYTSGSTGRPKGVAVEHKQVLNRLAWMWEAYRFAPGEVSCQKTALNFVDSLWELLGPLLAGVSSVIIPDQEVKDPYALVERLAEHRVSRIWLVPSLLRALLSTHEDLQQRLPGLRFWVTSGEALPVELLAEFQRVMPEATLYNLYGTSEVWDVTWYEAERGGERARRVAIGKPIRNMRVYVLDGEGRPVPIGVPGELHVGGVGLARGYLGSDELTGERFIGDPFGQEAGGRLYKTGDVVRYRENGDLEFLGRLDHQVKIRGFRVELGEIESVLARHPNVRQAVVTAREYGTGGTRLVAYIAADHAANGFSAQLASIVADERLSQWREVWDDVYRKEPAAESPTFDTAGWLNSYTGARFPAEEMAEYAANSEERILALNPQRVLDIGCGLGLLLFRAAPRCQHYCATDFSAAGLDRLAQHVTRAELKNVRLLHRAANDFTGFEPASFDTVVLNSVLQYFPDMNYVLEVLDGVLTILKPGGAIFLGDILSLPLLEMFHTSVEQHRASADVAREEIMRRVRKRLASNEQLAIHPAFFYGLPQRYPQIAGVRIEPKRGHLRNELTRFRYDVTLFAGPVPAPAFDTLTMEWHKEQLTLERVRGILLEQEPRVLEIRRVANGRLVFQPANDRSRISRAVDPEEFWALARQTSYSVRLRPSGPGFDDSFDVLFSRDQEPDFPVPADISLPLSKYANEPLQSMMAGKLVSSVRRFLQSELPDHMIPSAFSLMESFPLTPNGKVDRRALPEPDLSFAAARHSFVAPRTHIEERLRELWTEVLAIGKLGVDDNFFELGGHSLIATRLLSRMRDAFRIELPLRSIFDHPTIAGLARVVEEAQDRTQSVQAPAVTKLPRERYSARLDAAGNLDLTGVKTISEERH
jgi:amino acid adenylation domain-containing protein